MRRRVYRACHLAGQPGGCTGARSDAKIGFAGDVLCVISHERFALIMVQSSRLIAFEFVHTVGPGFVAKALLLPFELRYV